MFASFEVSTQQGNSHAQGLSSDFYHLLCSCSLFSLLKHYFKKSRLLLGLLMVLPPSFALVSSSHSIVSLLIIRCLQLLQGADQSEKNSYSISTTLPRWVPAIPALQGNYFCRDPVSQQALFISSSASPDLHTKGCQEWAQVNYFYLTGDSFHASGQLPRKPILYNLRKLNWNNLIRCKFASQMCPRS